MTHHWQLTAVSAHFNLKFNTSKGIFKFHVLINHHLSSTIISVRVSVA